MTDAGITLSGRRTSITRDGASLANPIVVQIESCYAVPANRAMSAVLTIEESAGHAFLICINYLLLLVVFR